MVISDNQKLKYFYILEKLKEKCKNDFTQNEFAEILGISRPTFNKFWNGKYVDMNKLLCFANFIGEDILFWPREKV